MRWGISIPLLAVIGVEYAFASHHHHGRHHHVHLKPHAQQLEPRDVDWADRIPADMMEIRTITTTVFEDFVSTNTIDPTTTTIFAQLIRVPTNGVAVPVPAMPESPKQEWINAMPTQSMPTQSMPTQSMPTQSMPTQSMQTQSMPTQSMQTQSMPTQSMLSQSMPTLANIAKPVPAKDEQTTTVDMTKTVTEVQTVRASTSISISNVVPSSANTSVETRTDAPPPAPPAPTAPAKLDASPAPGLLPSLPQLPQALEDAPKDVVSDLPLSALPQALPSLPLSQILDPNGPAIPANLDWAALPKDGDFAIDHFGGRSKPSGTQIKYQGNVGIPWGSNVISVSPTKAHRYKYVVRFTGSITEPWTITIWNKVGPDGKMDGWYGHSALTFVLAPGETRYVAFDEDSEGAWGAAPGTHGLPVDKWGGFTSTWGEFSFGDAENDGWSGWDVSAIQAQIARQDVQGMRICMADGKGCSVITPQAKKVVNAYTESERHHDGIGGAAAPGPVRLVVDINYQEYE